MKLKKETKKSCEFCYKDFPMYYLEQVNKYCCWDSPRFCSTRKILVVDFKNQLERSFMKNPICDYCNEKKGLYYFKNNNSWCCSKTIQKCYKKRKGNDYKIIKMLIGHSLFCDYGCGQVAKYIFKSSGFVCCSHAAHTCPNVTKEISKTKRINDKNKNKKKKKKKWKFCKCGCGKKIYGTRKFLNRDHINKYYRKVGHPGSLYWKGKKRPDHSKKLRETAHHYRGKKGKYNHFSKAVKGGAHRKRTSIEQLKDRYPIFALEEEMRYDPKNPGEIQVRCKNHKCENSKEKNGWFTTTYKHIYQRIAALDVNQSGGTFLYCSNECKKECTLYNVNSTSLVNQFLRTTKIPDFDYTQDEYNTWRAEVLKRADYVCEYCQEEKATDCHHIKPQKLEPFFSLDPDYGLACCEKCHYKHGHKDECSTGQLAIKQC